MSKRFSATLTILATVALFFSLSLGQESGYLAQKLMVENDLRKRITEALSKIMDESRYVIDVSVDLELSDELEEQVTVLTGESAAATKTETTADQLSREAETGLRPERSRRETMVGLPIPGFEFEVEREPEASRESIEETPSTTTLAPVTTTEEGRVLSKTSSFKRPSVGHIRKLELSVILQEGAAPELIENIRQIVMVASRFNRARGDVLSIMTASFKERRDEKTAEQVLLKSIAEKIDALEKKRAEETTVEDDWQKELEKYKVEEEKRREEDRMFFQAELANLEMSAKERAFQQEKRDILRRDSLKLQSLNEEIQSLRNMLATTALTDSQAQETETVVQAKEQEKADLDSQIEAKLAMLESVQGDLDQLQNDMNDTPTMLVVLLSLLGALLLILVVVLIIIMLNNKARFRDAPPPWMYPPRRRRKKKVSEAPAVKVTPVAVAPATTPITSPPPPPAVEEDLGVLQSEINDIRKSVVSMSVGQPNTATRIVKEWMQEEAPPPPEPEKAAPETEESEEESGKKKKKKKK